MSIAAHDTIIDAFSDALRAKAKKDSRTAVTYTDAVDRDVRQAMRWIDSHYVGDGRGLGVTEAHVADVPLDEHTITNAKTGAKKKKLRLRYKLYDWMAGEDARGWPTGWWIRFAQDAWKGSTWRVVPAFPAAVLGALGYPLVTTARYIGDLTDEEKAELLRLLWHVDATNSRGKNDADEIRISEYLSRCPYGVELPIFDVDAVHPPKDMPKEEHAAFFERTGRAAAAIAVKVSEVWRRIAGVGIRWTVTNARGGLHGRSWILPERLRHKDLLIALCYEISRGCRELGVPHKFVGEGRDSKATDRYTKDDLAVLDLSPFHKTGDKRGGMWRTPGAAKDREDDPNSMPQTPVSELFGRMPWLTEIAPDKVGDWGEFSEEATDKILAICEAYSTTKDEEAIRSGQAVRGEDGKVRRVRKAAVEANEELGTTEFAEVALTIRELMPKGDSDGMKRHSVRLALAGWLYRNKLSEDAAIQTLLACGGNADDSRKAAKSTYARGNAGLGVAGRKRLTELLGQDGFDLLERAWGTDVASRVDNPEPLDHGDDEPDHGVLDPGPDPSDGEPSDEASGDDEILEDDQGPEVDESSAAETDSDSEPEDDTAASSASSQSSQSDAVGATSAAASETSGAPNPAAAARAKKIHPLSQAHLHLARAKGELAPGKRFDGKNPGSDVLTEVRDCLVRIKAGSSDSGKFWFVQKAVASTFAFAGLGLDLVTRTTMRGDTKFDTIRAVYKDVIAALYKWKPGDELPVISSLSQIRSAIGHWEYIKLTSAITDGLHRIGAPFGVLNRASIDTPQSSNERIRIKYLLDRATKCEKSEIRGPLKFLEDARKCGYLLNHQRCSTHNTVSKRPISCEREVSCRYCRSTSMSNIGEWMMRIWNHDKYVTFDVPATNDPVIKKILEKHEVDVNGRFVDPTPGSNEEDDAAKITLLPKAYEGEKRFHLTYAPNSKRGIKVKIKHRKRGRSKVVARKVVTDLLNRITIGFRESHDWKEFKKIFGHKIGARAWPTTTGVRVVMPASFLPRNKKGEIEAVGDSMPVEQETMFHLKAHKLWQDRSPRVVSKEEAATLILDARREIGEDFDRLVHDLSKDAPDAESPDLDRSEQELLSYPFLKNNAMKPIRNKAALRDMPWFSKDQMTAFKRLLARERKGIKDGDDEVKPHECPMPVPDDAGGTKPCRRTLHNSLECEQGTIAHNSQGKHYPREEAFELADQAGVSFSPYGVPLGCFAPAESASVDVLAPARANL